MPPQLQLNKVDPQFVTEVEAELGSSQAAYDVARTAAQAAQLAQKQATAAYNAAAQQVAALDAQQRYAAAEVKIAHDRLRDIAVASYVTGGAGVPLATLLSATSIGQFADRRAILNA